MFSKFGTYEPVGLFSTAHIISIFMCLFFIGIAVYFTRKISKKTYLKLLKVFTIVVTCLEIGKIILSLYEQQFNLDAWLPLYFCSLFIYALWLTWFKSNTIKEVGLSFIAYACIIAGMVFIVCPTTSFTWYPIFHYKCIYSMVFHSLMVYSGIMVYVTKSLEINIKSLLKYLIFTISFMLIALIINENFGSNLMFVSNPGVVPLQLLKDIYACSPVLFTFVMILAHTVLMSLFVYGVYKLVVYLTHKHEKKNNFVDIEELEDNSKAEL